MGLPQNVDLRVDQTDDTGQDGANDGSSDAVRGPKTEPHVSLGLARAGAGPAGAQAHAADTNPAGPQASPVSAHKPASKPGSGEIVRASARRLAGPEKPGGSAGTKRRTEPTVVVIPPAAARAGEGPRFGPQFSPEFGPRVTQDGPSAGVDPDRLTSRPLPKEGWSRHAVSLVLGFGLFGLGVLTGSQFFGASAPAQHTAKAALGAAKPAHAAVANAPQLAKTLRAEIHALQAKVAALQTSRAHTPGELRGLEKSLRSVKAETTASIAKLTAKLDKIEHKEAKVAASRHDHPTNVLPTGTIAHAASHSVKAAAASKAAVPAHKLRVFADWVVRDVYRGVALLDGPDGAIEVMRGDFIPGAGRVEAIEHRHGGWVIVTDRGLVRSMRD